MLLGASQWMAGAWYLPAPQPSVKDVNGQVLAVGDSVSIVGTVTSIAQIDFQYGNVLVTLIHPTTGATITVSSLATIKL